MKIYWYIVNVLILTAFSHVSYADIRTNNLPNGFQWQYIVDEKEPSPRFGQFWRDGIFIDNKIIILNTHHLIALDQKTGKKLWMYGLPAESASSEAKIHQTDSNEIIVIITDALIRINTDTGEMIDHYGYNVKKRSAFQFTELMPRQSIFFENMLFVFLGPELLSFHPKTLTRTKVATFNSSPKTIPEIYQKNLILGFQNGFLELFNPSQKQQDTLIFGSINKDFSIRQPVVLNSLIYIPTNKELLVYRGNQLFSQSNKFKEAILSMINNRIWMRQHDSGKLIEIDETLTVLREITFNSSKHINSINAPLIGTSSRLVHFDSIEGKLFVFDYTSDTLTLSKEILTEDFLDNPPLQYLDQKENYLLVGAFDGLYLIDINQL